MTQPLNSVKEQIPERPALRRELLKLRKTSSKEQRQHWDQDISQQVSALMRETRPHRLAVYWPIQAEPDLQLCYQELHQTGIELALPLVIAKGQALRFVKWAPGDAMDTDDFGIPIPRQRDTFVTPDVLLVPCVGFNQQHFRLGYGGGFYDRTLAELPHAKSIGIAYRLAACDFAPDVHDIALSMIVCEHP